MRIDRYTQKMQEALQAAQAIAYALGEDDQESALSGQEQMA